MQLCVLIETYWNVKLRGAYTNALTENVLIETYWNVKFYAGTVVWNGISVLIETYWNVKLRSLSLFLRPLLY